MHVFLFVFFYDCNVGVKASQFCSFQWSLKSVTTQWGLEMSLHIPSNMSNKSHRCWFCCIKGCPTCCHRTWLKHEIDWKSPLRSLRLARSQSWSITEPATCKQPAATSAALAGLLRPPASSVGTSRKLCERISWQLPGWCKALFARQAHSGHLVVLDCNPSEPRLEEMPSLKTTKKSYRWLTGRCREVAMQKIHRKMSGISSSKALCWCGLETKQFQNHWRKQHLIKSFSP